MNDQVILGAVLLVAIVVDSVAGSVLAGLPELGFVVHVLRSLSAGKSRKELQQWLKQSARCLSGGCGVFAGSCLLLLLLYFDQHHAVIAVGAWGYWAMYELGRQHKGHQSVNPTGSLHQVPVLNRPTFAARTYSETPKDQRTRAPVYSGTTTLHREFVCPSMQSEYEIPTFEHMFSASLRRPSSEVAATARKGVCESFETVMRMDSATEADQQTARNLADMVKEQLTSTMRCEMEVYGSPCGNMTVIGQSGEKPEVDVIVSVDTGLLKERLTEYFATASSDQRPLKSVDTLRPEALMRTATRALSEHLSGFRYWRSQFVGPEVKLVLLVPEEVGVFEYPIRMNFSVNNPYPLCLAHVLTRMDLGTAELILLVKRWADQRGISRVSKGHLHPYAWSLLVIHFLQSRAGATYASQKTTTIDIFAEFVRFYTSKFKGREVNLCVSFTRKRRRSALGRIPFIEDPLGYSNSAAQTLTHDGLQKLKYELARAGCILAAGERGAIPDLMAKWSPVVNM